MALGLSKARILAEKVGNYETFEKPELARWTYTVTGKDYGNAYKYRFTIRRPDGQEIASSRFVSRDPIIMKSAFEELSDAETNSVIINFGITYSTKYSTKSGGLFLVNNEVTSAGSTEKGDSKGNSLLSQFRQQKEDPSSLPETDLPETERSAYVQENTQEIDNRAPGYFDSVTLSDGTTMQVVAHKLTSQNLEYLSHQGPNELNQLGLVSVCENSKYLDCIVDNVVNKIPIPLGTRYAQDDQKEDVLRCYTV